VSRVSTVCFCASVFCIYQGNEYYGSLAKESTWQVHMCRSWFLLQYCSVHFLSCVFLTQLIAYVTSFNESVVANDFSEYGCLSLLSFPDWCGDGCFSHDSTCSVFCNLHAIQSGTQISSGMRCPYVSTHLLRLVQRFSAICMSASITCLCFDVMIM